MTAGKDVVHTRIWEEEAEPDNPFAARACFCSGYDVYGDLLGKVGWIEYLFLLFRLEPPERWQTTVLEGLAVAIANPGPRDPSVRAAMCGGVGGSTRAASLMAALAPGAGQLGGARELLLAMEMWYALGRDIELWSEHFRQPIDLGSDPEEDVWPAIQHRPGFDPNGSCCPAPVQQTLAFLAGLAPPGPLSWLLENRACLEHLAGGPLTMSGVAACALFHLGFRPEQGEMLYLILRLPGAAAHSLEQEEFGWRRYPLFTGKLHLEADSDPRLCNG